MTDEEENLETPCDEGVGVILERGVGFDFHEKANRLNMELKNILKRSLRHSRVEVNFNAIFDQKCLKDYRFVKKVIAQIASIIGWPVVSSRNGYKCDQFT